MYSLPANKVELWAYLESERFLDPVFREFYQERDVVQEERRMRTDSQPIGRLIEQLLVTAYIAHPYGHPLVGYMSDLQSFTREDAWAFYDKYYVPANMTVAVVGDVKADEVLPLLEKYFGRLPKGPLPDPASHGGAGADRREDRSSSRTRPSRSTSRPTTGRRRRTPTTRSTTRSRTSSPTGAPRASTAAWSVTRRSRPSPAPSTAYPATSTRT